MEVVQVTWSVAGELAIVATPQFREPMPLGVVMRALHATEAEIREYVLLGDESMAPLLAKTLSNAENPVDYIALKQQRDGDAPPLRTAFVAELLRGLFPHLPDDGAVAHRARYLGYMAHRVLRVAAGVADVDDRDHVGSKRADVTGTLLGQLFDRNLISTVRTATRLMVAALTKGKAPVLDSVFCPDVMTSKIASAMSTGNWGGTRIGVTQVRKSLNYIDSISLLRRVTLPSQKKTTQTRMRQLKGSLFGRFCPADTPEGENCGLVRQTTPLAGISLERPQEELLAAIAAAPGVEMYGAVAQDAPRPDCSQLFVNGVIVGRVPLDAARGVVTAIRDERLRAGLYDAGVWGDEENNVHVSTGDGQSNAPKSWDALVQTGAIEYLDANEEEHARVAMWQHEVDAQPGVYSHYEVHPSTIVSVVAASMPFPEHDQSPRVVYQCSMGKQGMGLPCFNFRQRIDGWLPVLDAPQRPLCATRMSVHTHSTSRHAFGRDAASRKARVFEAPTDMPTGQNAVVLIASIDGFNQEDSLIMNEAAIQRGFFRATLYRVYETEAQRDEVIELPAAGVRMRGGNYSKLEEDGLPAVGTSLKPGDVIIGITGEPLIVGGARTDRSKILRGTECGIVDQVIVTDNIQTRERIARVRLRTARDPVIGDKFASRHSQKGTVSKRTAAVEMPWNAEGMQADMIINPHGQPSRMTIGHLIEMIVGKGAALEGDLADATPFDGNGSIELVRKVLHRYGFNDLGWEPMYSGETGEMLCDEYGSPLRGLFFQGPIFYQRLKHCVDDKIQARRSGPRDPLTRQPTKSRGTGGGLRYGEMERDAALASGASEFVRDRLLYASDHHVALVCAVCGYKAEHSGHGVGPACRVCREAAQIEPVPMPYAASLLLQELAAMGVSATMGLEPE